MNERQKRFADEYIISGNVYRAALEVGYSESYAKTHSHKILENVSVKSYIDERLKLLESEKIAKQDEVLQYLTSVMRGEQTEQVLIGTGQGYQDVIDINVGSKDRIKAAELLGRRYRLFTDNVNIATDTSISITFNEVGRDES